MDVCCAAGEPVRYDYEPKGSVVSLGPGLEGYLVTGEASFGPRKQLLAAARQICLQGSATEGQTC